MWWWLCGALVAFAMLMAPLVGIFAQPFSPFWFGVQGTGHVPVDQISVGDSPPVRLGPQPLVTDFQRYRLAVDAGFSREEAIIATAISIAENGGGDPAALSSVNFDGSRDIGLFQINSAWWPRFGGMTALTDPVRNAMAAHAIFQIQNWCAWSTFEASCGPGHTSSYRNYLPRARVAARP